MDRSVHEFEVVELLYGFRTELKALDGGQELLVHLIADDGDKLGIALELDFTDTADAVYIFDYVYIVRSDKLCAVAPVSLVTVVFLGVVGSGDINAALTAELADSERQLGSGTETVEEIDLDSVGREYVGDNFGKLARVVAHIVAYDYRYLGLILESDLKIVGKPLCGGSYRIDVHTVCAGTHDTAQTAGTEFEVTIETVDKFGFVVGVKHATHLGTSFFIVTVGEPSLGFFGHHLDEVFIFHILKFFGIKVFGQFC